LLKRKQKKKTIFGQEEQPCIKKKMHEEQ